MLGGKKTASVKVTAHEKTLKENLETERKKWKEIGKSF
jgi:hypothetical protein